MDSTAKSAHIVASIEDLLSKILCLLSIKDLLRFKSVSKRWRALISDPNFRHLCSPNPSPAGIFLPPDLSEYVPFSALNSRTFLLNFPYQYSHSCNGLLLLGSNSNGLVYNPTTGCCLFLPELPEPVGEGWRLAGGMTLAFDPLKSRHYNVVCMFRKYPNHLMIQMYSPETRSWGVCGEPFRGTLDFENGVYWNGAVHWLSHEGVFYFKVKNQVLEKMSILPFRYNPTFNDDHYFGHSCDHLHLIEKPSSGDPYNVYEMRRDYSEWFVKYRVNLGPVIAANKKMFFNCGNPDYRFRVLNVIRGEADEDSFLVVKTSAKIIRYKLVSEKFDVLYVFENLRPLERRNMKDKGLEYIESLCCV